MKHAFGAAFCAALILASAIAAPALAQEKRGAVTEADIATAQSYAKWTEPFGQYNLAGVAVFEEDARLMIAYGVGKETSQDWTRRIIVNIMGLPDDPRGQQLAMLSYITGLRDYIEGLAAQGYRVEGKRLSGYSSTPIDVSDENAPPPQHALYQYRFGKDTPDEDNAGIIFPLEGRLVNFQMQARAGKRLSAQDVEKLSHMLMNYMDVWASAQKKNPDNAKKE